MKKITYYLGEKNDNSQEYYKDISIFTQKTIENLNNTLGKNVEKYIEYIDTNNIEPLRDKNEYLLEMLMIGVYWNTYINKAINLNNISGRILIKLSYLRENEKLKKIVDVNRGILNTLLLNKESLEDIHISMDNYIKLLSYLEATGDYKQEIKRLNRWKEYFEINKNAEEVILMCSKFAKIFQYNSDKEIGVYTKNVPIFLDDVYEKYKWREDLLLCSRKRVEYHLNMVGAEIMNRAYKEVFIKSKEKRLLLPACMRIKNEYDCKAQKTDEGYICANCSKKCNVNKYDKLGKKYDFKVYIIPHESNISLNKKIKYGDIGIIGVACVLNLISGGLKAKNLGFVPQCVILDFCGCKSHWSEEKMITDINDKRLLSCFERK